MKFTIGNTEISEQEMDIIHEANSFAHQNKRNSSDDYDSDKVITFIEQNKETVQELLKGNMQHFFS